MQKYLKFLLIALVVLIVAGGGYAYYLYQKPCLGCDKDAHGCIGSAGYSWCEAKNKCLRVWEEKCETTTPADWKTYTDSVNGITFRYPNSLEPACAELQQPSVVVTLPSNITNGCVVPPSARATDSQTTINGVNFCLSTGSDAGAGQLYHSYYYTTLKNGNYYTLEYTVHTSGCGVFKNADDVNAPGNERYKDCLDCAKNYDGVVIPLIEKSVSTFKFAPVIDQGSACTSSGGTVATQTCYCSGTKDFYNNCAIGACTCTPNPAYARQIKNCNCGQGKCFDGSKCVNISY